MFIYLFQTKLKSLELYVYHRKYIPSIEPFIGEMLDSQLFGKNDLWLSQITLASTATGLNCFPLSPYQFTHFIFILHFSGKA